MLRERWNEIVPADNDADKRGARLGLAGTSEGFDGERRCLHLFVRWYTFVLSSVEEVLALVRDKRPLCKGTTSVAARCRSFACGFGTSHGFVVDALLLQQDLR